MAGKLRYWKEKDGRFWARMAVPGPVQKIIGRSEIIEPLGGDRRAALKNHPAAVTRLRAQIAAAEAVLRGEATTTPSREPITTADFGRAVWQRYTAAIEADEAARAARPGPVEVEKAQRALREKLQSGEIKVNKSDPESVLKATIDFLVVKDAAGHDSYLREARLAALKRELAAGETHQVEHEIDAYLDRLHLSAEPGSAERAVLAKQMMRAEIEALERTIERDSGDYLHLWPCRSTWCAL